MQQYVIECITALFGGLNKNLEIVHDLPLAMKLL